MQMFVIDNVDSVIRTNKKNYPQIFLEECKYEMKKNKMENLINDNQDPSLSNKQSAELIMNLITMTLMINLLKIKTIL